MLVSCLAFSCTQEPVGNGTEEPAMSKAVEVLNLTPDFISFTGVEKDKYYEPGSLLTLTLSPGEILSSGFSSVHPEHIHIHAGDKVYLPAFPEISEEYTQELSVEIEVPQTDFEVVVCYSVQQQLSETGFTMRIEDSEPVRLYGVSEEEKYNYFDCYLLTPDAYAIGTVQFKMGDGEWMDISSVTGCSLSRSEYLDNVYKISVRPDYQDVTADVAVRVSGEQHGRYNIVWENADAVYLDMESSVLPSTAIDGETVTAELWINNDYYLAGASSSVEGTEVSVPSQFYVQFEMPAEDITVTLDILDKIPVSYKQSENITEAQFYDADDVFYGVPTDKGIPGEYVYLFAVANDGFKPAEAVLETGEKFKFVHYAYNQYRAAVLIPENAESVSAGIETVVAYTVTGHENVVFNGGNIYAEGETVSMSIYVPDGQRISSVVATAEGGQEVEVSLDLPYASFTMPASDVSVDVTYEEVSTEQVSVIAYYDGNSYNVNSSDNFDWDFSEGFTVNKGSTFYLSVFNWSVGNFYVGIKVGENTAVYSANYDDMMGEYSFGKAIVADGDVVIKVGATEDEVSF